MSDNTIFLSGSNFRTGFTAGRIQIPTEVAPGISVGLPIAYTIRKPKYRQAIYQSASLTLSTEKTFLPLRSFSSTVGEIFNIDNLDTMYKLDYARVINVRATTMSVETDVNVCMSYYDMYGKKGFVTTTLSQESENFTPIIGASLGIASIYVTSEVATTVILEFEISNTFELPITDNGLKSQLLLVSGFLPGNNGYNVLWMSTFNDTAPYGFSWDGNYYTSLTTDPTVSESRPRPWFEILFNGDPFDEDISDHIFTFQQNVYGLGNGTQFTNPNYPNIGSQTLESKYIYGPANFTEGFVSWKG